MKKTEQTHVRKEWIKPALVVLVRYNPEETVLETCKLGDWSYVGSGGFWQRCQANACQNCISFGSS